MEVHEHPQPNGTVGLIRSRIDHRDLRGIDSTMAKHNQYAAWDASTPPGMPTASTAIATLPPPLPAKSCLAFFFGSFCLLKAGYFPQIACRLRELEQAADSPN
jgi:hypothetical protein